VILAGLLWKVFAHYSLGLGQAYLYNAFDARMDNLAVGCLLAALVSNPGFETFARSVARAAWMPLVTIFALAALSGLSPISRHLFGFTAYSVLVAILIAQLLQLHSSRLWSWLDWGWVRYLGTISYPIYLYHGWGIGLGEWITGLPHLGRFLCGVVFTVVAASGSYFIVERPFLMLKRRFAV
jgi:peptidoglycan/LPS O-acetylase OafA/YrhL